MLQFGNIGASQIGKKYGGLIANLVVAQAPLS
jgi:hypothetical protein